MFPWVCGYATEPLDLTPVIADRTNYALFGEHGGVLFVRLQPGIYEAHTQVLPSGRGKWTVNMVEEALSWMFCRTDAAEIMTRVPHGNLGAKALARAIHGQFEFTNQAGWVMDGKVVAADIYALSIQHWMKHAPNLVERGDWFHERINAEYVRLGFNEPSHPEDLTHDRYVGAATEMILGGQPDKGVIFYNRWAVMAGYPKAEIVAHSPLAIDVGDGAVLIVRDNSFWMVKCR